MDGVGIQTHGRRSPLSRFAIQAHLCYTPYHSHVVLRHRGHRRHQLGAPPAPPHLARDLLFGGGSQRTLPEICSSAVAPNEHMSARVRSNSMSSSAGSCSTRRASSPPASGSFGLRELANCESVRCSRTSNVAQCTICGSNPMRVSTARACRAPSRAWSVTMHNLRVESHAREHRARMPRPFARVVGDARPFADVVQDPRQQERRILVTRVVLRGARRHAGRQKMCRIPASKSAVDWSLV